MEHGNDLTRRRMLQLTGVGVLGAGAMLAGVGCSSGNTPSSSSTKTESVELTVYDPTGSIEITQTFAPRLDSLDNKTIAFVGDDMWEEDRTFPLIKQLMEQKYPSITILT